MLTVMSLLRKRYDMIAHILQTVPQGTSSLGVANHNSKLAARRS